MLDNAMSQTQQIRELNDAFRRSLSGGKIMVTAAFAALPIEVQCEVLELIRHFDGFDEDNDSYHEHDFVSVEARGGTFFAKIDYYDLSLRNGSEDPSDQAKTTRVLTIMLASDY